MKLPLLLSVPHGGWRVPAEAKPFCILSEQQIEEDGDEGAREIYDLETEVKAFITTEIARAVVDLNRAPDDRRADGVVKTHTCWNVPVYSKPLPEEVVRRLLERCYDPYHTQLRELTHTGVKLAIDCHTMATKAPPVGPDPGSERPRICLSHADGTCPDRWLEALVECFKETFGPDVNVNDPFKGGFITRSHATEMPWVQLEISRAPFMTASEKRESVLLALWSWCSRSV